MSPEPQFKGCSCGEQNISQFHKNAAKPSGVQTQCRRCQCRGNTISARKRMTGWDKESYEAAQRKQLGLCAICSEPSSKELAGDHNHKTGKRRGLLCFTCNAALGAFDDSPEKLKKALEYLLKYEEITIG